MKYIEDSGLLNYRFRNGMLMLPFYRYRIMSQINNGLNIAPKQVKDNIFKKLGRIVCYLKMCKIQRAKFVFFTSTLFNVKNPQGVFFNSLDGFYYDLYPEDCLLVEDADGAYFWRTTDSYQGLSFINTYLLSLSSIIARIIHFFPYKRNPDVYEFSKNEYASFLSVKELEMEDLRVAIYGKLIKWLLHRTQCKVAFVNCACYGGYSAIIINIAKKLGIRTVELQHGCIDEGNYAYNESLFAGNEHYGYYIPDEIWTFGAFWHKFIKWKTKKVLVGNPYLNTFIKSKIVTKSSIDFLVISQPVYNIIISFVSELAELYPEKRIVVRLHPRDDINEYDSLRMYSNIHFSSSVNNLYEEIGRSESIIGLFSTCLYESLAFNKKLFIIDCEWSRNSFPRSIGVWVKSAREIGTGKTESIEGDDLWFPDFEGAVCSQLDQYVK